MTLRAPRRIAALVAAPALLASGVALAAPGADAAATSEPTYKGSAMALSVKVGLAGSSILDEVLPSLVTYPPGATKSLLELPQELAQVVTLKVLNVSSEVENGVLASNANTASLGILGDVIGARVLNADCLADEGDVSGDSQVAGLTIAGTKVPVDPGPNFKIEIPDALAALVKGSIVIDEQTETEDGGLRVRALHINLVVAPTAIEDALNSVIATVRETAQQLKVVVEEVTGKTLSQLVGDVDKAAKQPRAKAAKKGAQNADSAEVRASAAAPAAPAAPQAPAASQAPAEAAAPATGTEKTDGADVDAEAAAEAQAEAEAAETADTAQGADEATVADEATAADEAAATEEADEAAAAARAERSEKGAKTGQVAEPTVAENTDPALATQPAPAAPAPAEAAPAETPATTKAKGSDVPVLDKVTKAIPAADSIAGALGVDIVVSQVTCQGTPGVAQIDELPGTGGNGDGVRNVAVGGLGLLLVGGTAVALTRRRRSGLHAA